MNSRDIVRKAWQITQVHLKKLIWYGAAPAFFSVVVSSIYLAYQYNAFRTSALFSAESDQHVVETARTLWEVVASHPGASLTLVLVSVFFLIGYTIIPPIFRGTLIHAIMKIKDYEPIEGSVEVGVRRFFPLFEFGLLTGSFSIITLFTEGSFVVRWWGVNIFLVILPILLFVVMVGLIINFLFAYAEYFIVLDNKRLIESIKESAVLVLSNLRKTFLIFMLMLLISARIILNVILVLLIPSLVILLTGWFASSFWSVVGVVLISIFSVAILLVSSYLLGLFHVFATAVWVLTYAILAHKTKPPIKDVDLGQGNTKHIFPDPITPHAAPPSASPATTEIPATMAIRY
ncbi:hypothetical protein JXA05_04200 [Candidatus Peregrinibacteria bacterium]|nr:hypothetical protein [Candidatus Peregrinibacteria bacterium]